MPIETKDKREVERERKNSKISAKSAALPVNDGDDDGTII
jgi:hypothetical protein